MKKIIKKIIDIIFIIVIAALVGYFILRNMGFIEIYEVETGSMEDGIHPGDYVLIYRKDTYQIGDIVTYIKNDYYVTHRIIKEDENGVITKGDANNTEDDEIDKSTILGKVILIGGILNIIIEYKFAIVSLLLGVYLLSCYFGKEIDSENNKEEITNTIGKSENVSEQSELVFRKKYKKRIRHKYRIK